MELKRRYSVRNQSNLMEKKDIRAMAIEIYENYSLGDDQRKPT